MEREQQEGSVFKVTKGIVLWNQVTIRLILAFKGLQRMTLFPKLMYLDQNFFLI